MCLLCIAGLCHTLHACCCCIPPLQSLCCVGLQVRTLCRRQFYVRALGNKVAACQHAHHRGGPTRGFDAPGQQQRHVQMPQGDSWSNTGILAAPYNTGILSNPLAARR